MQASTIPAVDTPRRRRGTVATLRHETLACALLALAAVFRLAVLHEFRTQNPFAAFPLLDAELYWQRAGEMAAGQWIDGEPFHIAPLYPYLIGLLRWAGGGMLSLQLAQLALHLATGALVFAAARARFGPRAALVALATFLVLAEPALFATRVLGTTLQLFLVALLWWDGARLVTSDTATPGHAARVGLWLGLFALAYPAALLLVPAFVAWLLARAAAPGGALRAAAGAAAACATVGLATAHNAAVSGEFIPVSSHSGITLAAGNAPGSVGIFTPLTDTSNGVLDQAEESARAFRAATGRDGSWNEIDRFYRNRVLRWMAANPGPAAVLLARKAYWFLTSQDYDNVTAFALEREYGLQDSSRWIPVETPWILGAAAIGVLLALRRPRAFALELSLVALPFAVCVAFMYSARYRAVALPVLCGLVGWAATGWRDLRLPRPAVAALLLLPLPLLAINAATGFGSVDFMREDFARVLADRHLRSARVHREAGRLAAAEHHYLRAAAVDGDDPTPLRELAALHLIEDDLPAARRTALAALQRRAEDVPALHVLYDTQVREEDYRSAIITLHVLEKLTPEDAGVQLALAWLYGACPDTSLHDGHRADYHARAAARLTGSETPETLVALALAAGLNGDRAVATAAAERGAGLARAAGDAAAQGEIERLVGPLRDGRTVTSAPRQFEIDPPVGTPSRPPGRTPSGL